MMTRKMLLLAVGILAISGVNYAADTDNRVVPSYEDPAACAEAVVAKLGSSQALVWAMLRGYAAYILGVHAVDVDTSCASSLIQRSREL